LGDLIIFTSLRAIEAQHSLLVERAAGIYSFSHLTLQEYFTAWYIKENGRIPSLMSRLTDNRWREVFLMTASLLANADEFFEQIHQSIDRLLVGDPGLVQFLRWVAVRTDMAESREEQQYAVRLVYILLAHARDRTHILELAYALDVSLAQSLDLTLNHTHTLARTHNLARAHNLALALAHKLTRDRTLDVDLESALELAIQSVSALDSAYAQALAQAYTRTLTLARNLSIQLGLDYALYDIWITAVGFAQKGLALKQKTLSEALAGIANLLAGAIELAQQLSALDLVQQLRYLSLPASTASPDDWQQYADHLWSLLQTRGLSYDWQFTQEQIKKLRGYFAANELLVECLKGAVVTDRQAILAGLLAPPAEQNPAKG